MSILKVKQKKLYEELEKAVKKRLIQDVTKLLEKASIEDLLVVLTHAGISVKFTNEVYKKQTQTLLLQAVLCNNEEAAKAILNTAKENKILKEVILAPMNVSSKCGAEYAMTLPNIIMDSAEKVKYTQDLLNIVEESCGLREFFAIIEEDEREEIKDILKEAKNNDMLNKIYQVETGMATSKAIKVGVEAALAVGVVYGIIGIGLSIPLIVGVAGFAALRTGTIGGVSCGDKAASVLGVAGGIFCGVMAALVLGVAGGIFCGVMAIPVLGIANSVIVAGLSVPVTVGIVAAVALVVGLVAGGITYAISKPHDKLDGPDASKVAEQQSVTQKV